MARRLEAVVLAAGAGRRFGGAKLTAPYGRGVLIDGALAAAFAAPARSVTVTVGADPKVAPAARAFARRTGQTGRLRLVWVAEHQRGMGASLAAAVASLPPDAAGMFAFLGDMPRIPHAVSVLLARALDEGARAAAPAFAGRRGHPVLFSHTVFGELARLDGDMGAKAALEGLGEALALVAAPDDGVLFDVDTSAAAAAGY